MTRLLLPLAAIALLAGCATPQPAPDASGPYEGIPTARAEAPVAEAQPVAPTGDPDLDAFLADFAAAIDRHDWYGVARMMDPAAFAEQRALIEAGGASGAAVQVIRETLDLSGLASRTPERPWEGLDRIRVVTLREATANTPGIAGGESSYTITGDVRLDGGETLPIQFLVGSRGGAYAVLVPLG